MKLYLAAFVTALVTTWVVTPFVRILARRLQIVDLPDRHRKLHARAIPLGGGVAVLAGFLAAMGVVFWFSDSQRSAFQGNAVFVAGLTVASLFIVAVGLIDDRFHLRGRQKLVAQIVAAIILVASGLWIGGIEFLGSYVHLGLLSLPFTVFWMVGAINALNLIDGMDGLASSVGVVLSLSVAAMAALVGHPTEAFLALALAGALSGFLWYNRPPATIFLGDAGSMLIGLVVGALAIRAALKGPTTVALIAPTAVWAIPILDVAMAILRRRLTGRSIYETDRNHLHHRLQGQGFGSRGTVMLIGLFCTITATAAVFSVYLGSELLALGVVGGLFATLIVTRVFGYQELTLLRQRLRALTRSLVPGKTSHVPEPSPTTSQMQGSREWDELWRTLIEFAERFDLASVQLNLNLPMIAEEFHAEWQRRERPIDADLWHCDLPLKAGNATIGRLRLTGSSRVAGACAWMGEIVAGLQPFETQLLELIGEYSKFPGDAEKSDSPILRRRDDQVHVATPHTSDRTEVWPETRDAAVQMPGSSN